MNADAERTVSDWANPIVVGGTEVDLSPGDPNTEPFAFVVARLDNDLIFSGHFDP
ncbi:MAG: hypothetical protein ABIQ70_13575 [Dokdonella sp.]